MSDGDLVSVVIPAHNAAATIGETLLSVRSQTHRMLEILVIDDGSTDGTADIVRAHAALDSRIRLVQLKNGGVAAARNRGIEEAAAGLVAFVDADDLWAPHKIEKQIAALRKEGPSVALVYTWWARIDAASRITTRCGPTEAGDVLERLCLDNFVGNGSSILVTKADRIQLRPDAYAKAPLVCGSRGHPGDGRNHDAGRDQRVFTNHADRHSDGIARDKSEQQSCRCRSHRAEN